MGYSAPEARSKTQQRMTELAQRLGELSGVDVGVTPLPSYDRVAQLIWRRDIDLAWMSPIPLISLARNKSVLPILSLTRGANIHYRCALIVSATTHITAIEELFGKRAAWVDQHSASGYVLPRIELARHGIGPKNLASERFFGSHDAVVRAVASGRADFGATFARLAPNGEVAGSWIRTPGLARSIRVLATFGQVPPDAIVVRRDMNGELRDRLSRGFRALTSSPKDHMLVSDVFGADGFQVPHRSTYESLRKQVFDAYQHGLLETEATQDRAFLDVAATLEQRIPAHAFGAKPAHKPAAPKPPVPKPTARRR